MGWFATPRQSALASWARKTAIINAGNPMSTTKRKSKAAAAGAENIAAPDGSTDQLSKSHAAQAEALAKVAELEVSRRDALVAGADVPAIAVLDAEIAEQSLTASIEADRIAAIEQRNAEDLWRRRVEAHKALIASVEERLAEREAAGAERKPRPSARSLLSTWPGPLWRSEKYRPQARPPRHAGRSIWAMATRCCWAASSELRSAPSFTACRA